MLATQSATSVVVSALNTHEDFWSGEKISKHRAASSPVTACLDSRQKCSGRLRESARGEAGGARPQSGIRKVSRLSQPILERRVAFRKYGVTSFRYFTCTHIKNLESLIKMHFVLIFSEHYVLCEL